MKIVNDPPRKILCIGDVDVDMVITLPEVPGPDEKINGALAVRSPGGMAANVAVGLARLGTPVRLIAAVGDDADGTFLRDRLHHEGVDTGSLVLRMGVPTFTCIVMVTAGGEKSLIRVVTDAYLPRQDEITAQDFADVSHLHMTLGSAPLTAHAFSIAKKLGVARSLDMETADILSVDAVDLAGILGMTDILFCSRNALHKAQEMFSAAEIDPGKVRGLRHSLITRGPDGAELQTPDRWLEVPGHRIAPVDTTGAGDSFAATFLHAIRGGQSEEDALKLSNAAGALSALALGAQSGLPTEGAIARFLQENGCHLSDPV